MHGVSTQFSKWRGVRASLTRFSVSIGGVISLDLPLSKTLSLPRNTCKLYFNYKIQNISNIFDVLVIMLAYNAKYTVINNEKLVFCLVNLLG